MQLKFLIFGFVLFSAGLCFWLFANWYAWSMADFDCVDGYWACRRRIMVPTILQVGLPSVAWMIFAALLWRKGTRS